MPIALALDADPATLELLREWLADAGWRVVDPAALRALTPPAPVQLVLVDLAYPQRAAAAAALQRVAQAHAGAPVLALSATFHASVDPHGELSRTLGVGAVLPKPLRRDALLRAIGTLAPTRPETTP